MDGPDHSDVPEKPLDGQSFTFEGGDDQEGAESEDGALSLEELSQSYARVLGQSDSEESAEPEIKIFDESEDDEAQENSSAPERVTPLGIIEAILFVGREDDCGIRAAELSSLMRGVSEKEIASFVAELNTLYESSGSAIRIVEQSDGFRVSLADDFEYVRERFYGRIREITLTQAAIDCLALIAYQPGISRKKLEEQRSEPSGGILSQLVRRQLVDVRRVGEGKNRVATYYPTEKLTELAGLDNLEDLPQVEEFE